MSTPSPSVVLGTGGGVTDLSEGLSRARHGLDTLAVMGERFASVPIHSGV